MTSLAVVGLPRQLKSDSASALVSKLTATACNNRKGPFHFQYHLKTTRIIIVGEADKRRIIISLGYLVFYRALLQLEVEALHCIVLDVLASIATPA